MFEQNFSFLAGKEVIAKAFDARKFFAFEPDLEEDLLDHVFGEGRGFGEHDRHAIDMRPLVMEEAAKGRFIAECDLAKEFGIGMDGRFLHRSMNGW
jgi:hypothetical protein